jgi:hypothetical protein
MTRKVELVRESGPISIFVSARIDADGSVLLSGQDLGARVEEVWGDSDYEYWLRIPAAAKDDMILTLLEQLYAGEPAVVSRLKALLESNGIACEFSSYA